MKNFKVFEVLTTNLDINDGVFIHTLYSNLDSAINRMKMELEDKKHRGMIEDIEGKLCEYDGLSLSYTPCKDKPSIYYRSHFGNYRCVLFIKERTVHI